MNTDTGVVDAYQHMSPMVDTVVYMQWLYKQCKDKGCRFVHDEIKGLLRDQAEKLKKKYKAQLITAPDSALKNWLDIKMCIH